MIMLIKKMEYDQLNKCKVDEKKQASIFDKWTRENFKLTAELNENDEDSNNDVIPCKIR